MHYHFYLWTNLVRTCIELACTMVWYNDALTSSFGCQTCILMRYNTLQNYRQFRKSTVKSQCELLYFSLFRNRKIWNEIYPTSHSTSLQFSDASNCSQTYSLIPEPPALFKISLSFVKLANLSKIEYHQKKIAHEQSVNTTSKCYYRKCDGNWNLLRISLRRGPKIGASTVKTIALKPALSARRTSFLVSSRSL